MFRWIKQHKKTSMLLADAAVIPLWGLMYLISTLLLTHTNTVCDWTRYGGACITCGGTHFVKEFLSFHFIEAFHQNELLFFTALYLIISLVFVNLLVLFDLRFAGRILKWMYNIPVLIIYIACLFLFLILRNMALWELLFKVAQHYLSQLL